MGFYAFTSILTKNNKFAAILAIAQNSIYWWISVQLAMDSVLVWIKIIEVSVKAMQYFCIPLTDHSLSYQPVLHNISVSDVQSPFSNFSLFVFIFHFVSFHNTFDHQKLYELDTSHRSYLFNRSITWNYTEVHLITTRDRADITKPLRLLRTLFTTVLTYFCLIYCSK